MCHSSGQKHASHLPYILIILVILYNKWTDSTVNNSELFLRDVSNKQLHIYS